jgi:hypothetical protein
MAAHKKPKRRNDDKLEAFALELAKGKSAWEAAKAVGYPEGTSMRAACIALSCFCTKCDTTDG